MEHLIGVLNYFLCFIVLISIVVFIHEFGHYFVAKLCGVKVEIFSLGFGKELVGWTDKSGTRWKISVLPLGGYVKMFGDSDPASNPDFNKLGEMSAIEKEQAFHFKSLAAKAAVVFAGPAANYISAILIMACMLVSYGKITAAPVISQVAPHSAADKAGIKPGDVILEVDNSTIETFDDIQKVIIYNLGTPVMVKVLRADEELSLELTPVLKKIKYSFGSEVEVPVVGIASTEVIRNYFNPGEAFIQAIKDSYNLSTGILTGLGQIISGKRSTDQLGGPIKIAQLSSEVVKLGFEKILWFIALISINLGLLNLLPIPMLDGGHLLYYLIEFISGRPVAKKVQEYGLRLGFTLLIGLMIFVTINDIKGLF